MTETMPFGKWKGHRLEDVPGSYLEWVLGVAKTKSLRQAIEEELDRREAGHERRRQQQAPPPPPPRGRSPLAEPTIAAAALDIVNAGYRQTALKRHPDHGGDVEAMKAVNLAADALRRLLEGGAR